MPTWLIPLLKWLVKLGPVVYDLYKVVVKIARDKGKTIPTRKEFKEYLREEQQKRVSSKHPP